MRTRLRSKATLLFVAFAALLLAVAGTTMALTADPSGTTAPAPTIQSDKADYFPGETVTLTGSNWQPGESVHINVNDEEGNTWSRNTDVTADENGAIRDEFQLPDWFVATYKVTATGAQSGVATTSFTDGNVRFTATPPAPSSWTVNYKLYGGPGNANNSCSDTVSTPTNGSVTISGTGTPPVQVNVSGNQSLKLVSMTENDPFLGFKRWTLANLTTPVANDACLSGQGATHNLVAHFNRAPIANPQPEVTTDEDTSKLITLSAIDPENDPLTYKIISLPTNGKFYKGNSTAAADEIKSADLPFTLPGSGNQVTYKPNADFNGNDSFAFRANDGISDSPNTASVPIKVNPINDAPVGTDDTKTMNEDGGPLSIDFGALVSDVETSDANLTYNITAPPAAQGSLSGGPGPTRTFTPAANFNGTVNINYTVTDRGDPDNCGPANPPSCTAAKTSTQKTVTINVTAVNDTPVAEDDSAETAEDTSALIDVKANDTDVDGDTLTITNVTTPAHGTAVVESGKVKYTPAPNYYGPDSFSYTISDGNGGTDTADVSVTVTPVNDDPVAEDDVLTTDEDTAANGNVLANDTDVDNPNNGNAGLTVKDGQPVTGPAHGNLTLNADGSYTYTPDENYHGSDSFTYKATDGNAENADSDLATVNITVTPVNDKPTADAQSVTTDEDVAKPITLTGNDVDGDTLSYTIVAAPTHGTLSGTGANLTYTPAADYNGPDSFTIKTNDGTVDSDVATVSITVTAVNDKPVVTNLQGADTANEGETKAYTFTITDNDSSNFTFASGSPTCGAPKGEVVSGSAQINGNNGSFECKFLDGGVPPTQVSVSAKVTDDSQASSDAATKNVAVSNVAPKIDSLTGPAQVLTNQPVTFTGAHSDPAGLLDNPFTWQWSGGTSTDTDKNNSYVTKFSACGPQNVKATVTDKDTGTSAEATLSTPVQAYNGNFLPPLQTGKDNLVQKGQVVPVKITVAGCDGLNLAGLSPYIQLFSGDPTTAINEADYVVPTASVSSADTGQNMRPVADGYIYNLRVPSDSKATVGAKYYIRVSPFGVASGQHMMISIQIRK